MKNVKLVGRGLSALPVSVLSSAVQTLDVSDNELRSVEGLEDVKSLVGVREPVSIDWRRCACERADTSPLDSYAFSPITWWIWADSAPCHHCRCSMRATTGALNGVCVCAFSYG